MKEIKLSRNAPHEYRSGADWRMDHKGYCIIKVFYSEQYIGLRHYLGTSQDADLEIIGDDSYEIVQYLVKHGFVTSLQHAAYLGHELQKAQTAMRLKLEYVQDERLDFDKAYTSDPSDNTKK